MYVVKHTIYMFNVHNHVGSARTLHQKDLKYTVAVTYLQTSTDKTQLHTCTCITSLDTPYNIPTCTCTCKTEVQMRVHSLGLLTLETMRPVPLRLHVYKSAVAKATVHGYC